MIEDVRRFYYKVWKHYCQTRADIYALGTVWQTHNKITETTQTWLKESKTVQDLLYKVYSTWMYSIFSSFDHSEKAKELNVKWQLEHFGMPEFQESEHVPDEFVVNYNGRFTPNFLRCNTICQNIKKTLGNIETVFELGAGTGHLARIMKLSGVKHYVIVDIPETMCYSLSFLKLNFPEKKFLLVESPDQSFELEDYDFIFVPTIFINSLCDHEYDLFVNTASMGEMNNVIVRHYMNFIQNVCKVKNLYTLNRFCNTGCPPYRMSENECSVHYDSRWKIHQWELEPLFTRCPYVDSIHARYVEIIAARMKEPDTFSEDVSYEDWNRLKNFHPDQNMFHHISPDLTMRGTLFKIWNSIRIRPTKENVSAMLKYMDYLNYRAKFEEYPYYLNLLTSLST